MALGDGLSLLFRIKADADQARREFSSLSTTVSKELRQIDTAGKSTTSTLGGLGSGISSIISPANLLAGAGIAAGAAIFALGKQALDAAGQLYDLSQKTNFSVETLSALKNAGETSGASIQSLSAALGIFDKNIVAAASGNDKLEATFKRLKISTTDNEQALRDAFRALMDMEGGAGQTAAAMELFGRSGKDVLAVIKETNGDLDVAIAKYREMGSLISTETATAADELGDSLTALGQGAKGAAADLMTSLAPAIKAIIFLVQQGINAIRGWIIVIKSMANVHPIIGQAQEMAANEASAKAQEGMRGGLAGRIPGLGIAGPPRAATPSSFGRIPGGGLLQTIDRNASWDIMGGGVIPGGGSGGGGGGRGGGGREEKGPDDFGGALLERLQKQYEGLTVKSNYARAAAELLNKEYAGLSRGVRQLILDQARQNDQTEREIKLRDQTRGFIAQQEEAVRQKIEGDKTEFDKVGELIAAYQAQGRELQDHIRIRLQLNALLLDSGRIMESLKGMTGPSVFGEGEVGGIVDAEGMGAAIEGLMGGEKAPVMPVPDFSAWKEAVADVKDMTVNAFGSMAEAMGAAIQAWVLYGAEGGQSIKKVMAAVLAALAAEAAVKAIFQLAEGFAKLAGFMPGPAAIHFKAAALYGAVAIGAGVAGRALAGNASAGSAAGSGPNGQSTTQQDKPTPIDRNRTGGEFRLVVDVRPTDAFVVRSFTEDWRKNGDTRLVVGSDGQKAVP